RVGDRRRALRPRGRLRAGAEALGDPRPAHARGPARRLAQPRGAPGPPRPRRRRDRRPRPPGRGGAVGRPARGEAARRVEGRSAAVVTARPPWREWVREAEDPARVAEKPEALDDLLVLDCSV